jgi:hypothetical protein
MVGVVNLIKIYLSTQVNVTMKPPIRLLYNVNNNNSNKELNEKSIFKK